MVDDVVEEEVVVEIEGIMTEDTMTAALVDPDDAVEEVLVDRHVEVMVDPEGHAVDMVDHAVMAVVADREAVADKEEVAALVRPTWAVVVVVEDMVDPVDEVVREEDMTERVEVVVVAEEAVMADINLWEMGRWRMSESESIKQAHCSMVPTSAL